MPMLWTINADGEAVPSYSRPNFTAPDPERLRGLRARFATEQAEMLSLQKGSRDPETARFFKEEGRDRLKLYRAADFLFKWASGADGWTPCASWPVELSSQFDFVNGMAS